MVQEDLFGYFAILGTDNGSRVCFVTEAGDAENIEELLISVGLGAEDVVNRSFIISIREDI